MNMKISKELHEELCTLEFKEYLFGSQLHGIATEESDEDYVRVIFDDFYSRFSSLARFYPNIHSFQYTQGKEMQFIWMTETQFWRGLFCADGNMLADIILLSGEFENPLFLCKTYKIIKGYLGLVKRDLKLHPKYDKKRFHAARSLHMAECLMDNILPTVEGIQFLKHLPLKSNEEYLKKEVELRATLNNLLDKGEINMYPVFEEKDPLIQMMMNSNNIKEFKY